MSSPRFNIDAIGWKKIGKGALIAGGAAVITYLLEAIPSVNFGTYTPVIMGIAGIVLNAARKWLSNFGK